MRRRDFLRVAAAAGLGLVLPGMTACRKETGLRIGDVPPQATLTDLHGNPVVLPSAFRGSIVLIHFWASWCPLCRAEMGVLESLFLRYGKGGATPCSVGVGESRETAEAYLGTERPTYPVLLDRSSSLVKPYGIAGIPTTYVLDRGNVIRHRILGRIDGDGLEKMITALL
ncbi:MAG: Thiol-disulfide oxidoreductase ResA [Syntrophaceae bacterium PtaU1.Bin231]|nr:MAG: Thiol-disulfide oxidoreductase ResA [Syntrophaceae bacterium PtaU1.Bin231]